MEKRALASTSSGQATLLKRPRTSQMNQGRYQSERDDMPRSSLTEEDFRRVVREELEHAKSHSTEYCQSCTRQWLALEDKVPSLENAVQKLVRQELEDVMPRWAENIQSSIGNALKDIMQQMPSKENDFQKQTKAVELGDSSSAHLRRAYAKSMANNGARNLQLQLQTKLSLPLFTGKKIEGEEGACISIALIDVNTGDVVTSGPESSIKLDIVVLEGDFNKDNEDNWAPEEFENYVVKEREGKALLLAGDLIVKLKRGIGKLGQLIFTDNSSWNRSKTFRIGVKVASGFCGNTRIREATTDAFPVKEHRGEAYKKHHPPASDDEVWRLEKIAKDGKSHQKLSEARIYKVEDFLLQLFTNPKKLREILGKSVTEKKWDSLVNHAKTCKTRWNIYLDYLDGMTKHGVVFNTDNQPIGLVKDRAYFATHQLSTQEKEYGDAIVKRALDNWNNVREFNGETFSDSMQKNSLVPRICAAPVGASSTAEGHNGVDSLALPVLLDGISHPAAHQPLSTDHLNVLISPGDIGFATVGSPIQSHGINLQCAMRSQTIDCRGPCEPSHTSVSKFSSGLVPECNHMMKDHQPMVCDDLVCWSPDAFIQTSPRDDLDCWSPDDFIQTSPRDDLDCWSPESFIQTPPRDEDAVTGTSKGVNGWLKIKAVLQWGFFYRRGVRLVPLDEPLNKVQA